MNAGRLIAAMILIASLGVSPLGAVDATLIVNVDKTGPAISPMMHGAFFEDINYGADGGLYAELIQNRSFEHKENLYAWSTENRRGDGSVQIESVDPLNANNTHYVRLQVRSAGRGFGCANAGFDGIAVKQDEYYLFSCYARCDAAFKDGLLAVLENDKGSVLGQCRVEGLGLQWKKFTGRIRCAGTSSNSHLLVLVLGTGQVDLDVISLFPENTWNRRPNGLRADLVQMLADMKPGFIRFPGGCIVEGKDLANAYRWKDTIGDVAERKQNWNRWQSAIRPGDAPQYYQTYGLGFFEYFQLCEDVGAEPVPILNCGMSCQFQDRELVPLDEIDPWVQDALDLIEFASGPADSTWGAKRAAMGHPKPFNLKLLGIGNEQWGERYFERYVIFYKAIKAKYPDIKLITTSGPGVDDQWWNLAWSKFKTIPAEIVDEHYYRPPQWFLEQTERYDRYDRDGPKVFAGEYAAHGRGRRNTLQCAIAEAAFMTGLVRNADVVVMASYAPLFNKVGFSQWVPDLIWFDNTRVFGTPSYYVHKLFALHRGDSVVPIELKEESAPLKTPQGMIGVGTWGTQAEYKDIKVVKDGKTLFESDFSKNTDGWKFTRGNWQVVDGCLRQTGSENDVRALAGDKTWSDYTLTLKARKLRGPEGFLVIFESPGDETVSWWNLGGWSNTLHGLEVPGLPETRVRGRIEANRWYDIKVELKGPSIRCSLDDKVIHDVTRTTPKTLYAVASRDESSDEAILKIVNVSDSPRQTAIDLRGSANIAEIGRAIVLTADSPNAENSLDAPTKVVPNEERITGIGRDFRHTFPAYSLTVLRLKMGG